MANLEKYKQAFCESFEITEDKLPGLAYQAIPNWDSVGHMNLVANLEDAFDIMRLMISSISLHSRRVWKFLKRSTT